MLFRGVNLVSLDSKGRLIIPARYRQILQEVCKGALVVTIDTEDACLLIYPLNEWEKIEKKIEALPNFHATARRIQRLLIGHATDLQMDKNGRVLIPALLRKHAVLEKRSILVGQGKKIELWDEEAWEAYRDQYLKNVQDKDEGPEELGSLSL